MSEGFVHFKFGTNVLMDVKFPQSEYESQRQNTSLYVGHPSE